ncbi:MAG TPA: BsuPI-related putative proteinase inhibitor [Thermodesulfobacteriota bacterium]
MRRAAALLLIVLAAAGCAGRGTTPETDPETTNRLLVGLGVEGGSGPNRTAFRVGEPVTLVLFVENRGQTPVRLVHPSAQRYDFTVSREGREVWRWSAATGAVFAQALQEIEVPPGERLVHRETWRGTDTAGQPVPPGRYAARGLVPLRGRQLESPPLEITLEP